MGAWIFGIHLNKLQQHKQLLSRTMGALLKKISCYNIIVTMPPDEGVWCCPQTCPSAPHIRAAHTCENPDSCSLKKQESQGQSWPVSQQITSNPSIQGCLSLISQLVFLKEICSVSANTLDGSNPCPSPLLTGFNRLALWNHSPEIPFGEIQEKPQF